MTGHELRNQRARLKMTQRQVADLVGYETNYISKLERYGSSELPPKASVVLEHTLKTASPATPRGKLKWNERWVFYRGMDSLPLSGKEVASLPPGTVYERASVGPEGLSDTTEWARYVRSADPAKSDQLETIKSED